MNDVRTVRTMGGRGKMLGNSLLTTVHSSAVRHSTLMLKFLCNCSSSKGCAKAPSPGMLASTRLSFSAAFCSRFNAWCNC
ncbi:hypothetical protein D3C79_995720 [compost metagenome]